MDLSEKLFEKWVNWRSRSQKQRDDLAKVTFEEVSTRLLWLVRFLIPDSALEIVASEKQLGFYGTTLFVPNEIGFFEDRSLNQALYVHQTLLAAATLKLNLKTRSVTLSSAHRLVEFLEELPLINTWLDERFPNFREFQEGLLSEYQNRLSLNSSIDRSLSGLVLARFLSRSGDTQASRWNSTSIKNNQSARKELSVALTWLPSESVLLTVDGSSSGKQKQKKDVKTELQKKGSSQIQHVDLEKEKEKTNPVTHSFEKLETADDYQGGYRFDSGDDELTDHQNALDELDMNKVTRGGEEVQSIYRADTMGFAALLAAEEPQERSPQKLFLPEWNHRKKNYLKDYCHLTVEALDPRDRDGQKGRDFLESLAKNYQSEIGQWKQQLESLLNEKKWKNRQLDGSEIDIDAYVRTSPDLLMKRTPDPRLYMNQRPGLREADLFVILDQSLSSDSWVNNRRVLDVSLEAVGLMGLLFEDGLDHVSVAGTWSHTRKNCHLKFYKEETTPWNHFFQVAHSITPQGYTRLGPSIRQATQILKTGKARKKILILLTDGKPTDLDGYEGSHGLQDVRQACTEARAQHIYPMAYTIDCTSKAYFPQMFEFYQILPRPNDLPEELFKLMLKVYQSK